MNFSFLTSQGKQGIFQNFECSIWDYYKQIYNQIKITYFLFISQSFERFFDSFFKTIKQEFYYNKKLGQANEKKFKFH